MATGMNLLEQPRLIGGESAHGQHALLVEFHLSFAGTIGDVPIPEGVNGHVHHLSHHVHGLGWRCSTKTVYGDIGSGLVLHKSS